MEQEYSVNWYKIGQISVFAGNKSQGNKDGLGTQASFNGPHGIAIDQRSGCLYVSDCDGHAIRKITPQGISIFIP